MNSIKEEFNQSSYKFERSLETEINLPYSLEDIQVGVNELANGKNFNTSIKKLQSNLIYLYSVSKFSNPNLPKNYKGWIGNNSINDSTLGVTINNPTFYSVLKFIKGGGINSLTLPFFTVSYNGNNHNFIFYYDGYVNPDSFYLPVGFTYLIDLGFQFSNDGLALNEVKRILTEIGFVVNNDDPKKLSFSSTLYGDRFFLNRDFKSYAYLFGDNVSGLIQQGTTSIGNFALQDTNDQFLYSNPSNYDNLNGFTVAPGTSKNFNNLFLFSDTRIQNLSANIESTNKNDYVFVNFTDTYGQNNYLNFKKINSAVYDDNFLYVSDEGNNNVVKIDVIGFTKEESHRLHNFQEVGIIGSFGGVRDNYQFNKPEIIDLYNNLLYVLDRGNQCIKVYNKDLGYENTIRKYSFYKNNPPKKIKIYNNFFYWLTENGLLFKLDLNLNLIEQKTLNTNGNEDFNDLIFSKKNNNLYILSEKNLYKYYSDNLNFIGRFTFDKSLENTTFRFVNLIDNQTNFDNLYQYINKNGRGIINAFQEDSFFIDLLSDYDFNIFNDDEISQNKNEFSSNFSYNKSILKILNNTLQLRNFLFRRIKILKRIVGKGINNTFINEYGGVTYFNPENLNITDFKSNLNNYIGTNEIFSRGVVNRVLENVYSLQVGLLDLLKPIIEYIEKQTTTKKTLNLNQNNNNGIMLESENKSSNNYFALENSLNLNNNIDVIIQENSLS